MAASKQTGGKNQQERETAGTRQVKQMSFMMAIVVLLYYISWLPYLVSRSVRVCAFMCVTVRDFEIRSEKLDFLYTSKIWVEINYH